MEVKPGEVLTSDPGDGKGLHFSSAVLGKIQNANESEKVLVKVHDDNKNIMLGALTCGNCDQFLFDIMPSKPFKPFTLVQQEIYFSWVIPQL